MRIHLKTTPSANIIPFAHQHRLTGTIHKWFGENSFHDTISLYSFSQLKGGKVSGQGLDFPKGADLFISCWDNNQVKLLITGIQNDPDIFEGLKVVEIIMQENPDLNNKEHFLVASPIYIQRNLENGKKKYYYYSDPESTALMTDTLKSKMAKAGLDIDETLKISFDQSFHKKGTKKIDYKHGNQTTQIRASWCPILIEGKPETKQFAWNVGIGNSTGIGFGAIK